jgi:hypothetical protein
MKKGERVVHICRNVRLARSSGSIDRDKADRIKESVKSGTKVFSYCSKITTVLSE